MAVGWIRLKNYKSLIYKKKSNIVAVDSNKGTKQIIQISVKIVNMYFDIILGIFGALCKINENYNVYFLYV